ncbi:MAG: methyl-accepting chemotaxis protein [Deltaproteobacteria bacterium]|jgi:methyl-accepting chemotaxis protein|nr:methyl-accepting chemotaxis protein [Deltaproteobacteria bacterium]
MLKNIRVGAKLLVLLAIPVVVVIVFSIGYALDKHREMQVMGAAVDLVAFASASGSLIHELQKERGLSSGFVASKGNAFVADLRTQRQETKVARKTFAEKMIAFAASNPDAKLDASFPPLVSRLDWLEGQHGRIDELSVPVEEVIAAYTATIRQMLDILNGILEYCSGIAMYNKASDFLHLINGKEFAGQERATLNGALSAGAFNKALYRAWIERVALQNEYLRIVLLQPSPATKKQFSSQVAPLREKVEEFRRQAYANVDKPNLEGNAQAWFAASTTYINGLRSVEIGMDAELEKMARTMADEAHWNFFATLAVLAAVLLCTFLLAWRIMRDITSALTHSVVFAQRVADGELGTELGIIRRDEFGILGQALNAMLAAIKGMIGKADAATESARQEAEKAQEATREAEDARKLAEQAKREGMVAAAEHFSAVVAILSSSSQTISKQLTLSDKGAQEQSVRLSGAAEAMEEMNAAVLEVARNSSNTLATADKARERAQQGAAKVLDVDSRISQLQGHTEKLKDAMTRLGARVQDIDKVLTVISDIADQTNLLALNAAIEAARAGDAGRGFAVVADEVRKLAEKTMNATKEVAEVLSGIQRDTEHNVATVDATLTEMTATTGLAKESGEALQSIVLLSDTTRDQISSIAAASTQQSATSEEINRSVEDVNRIALDTVAGMRQCMQDTHVLLEQVRELERLIAQLRAG